jgi:glycosyltransferase involved in cell wall biosynthesis
LSVALIVRNEADNLPRCLDALRFSDDILVIDDGSEDDTVAIAEKAGCRVLEHRMTTFAEQRNWAMEHGKPLREWVLHLDADEVITSDLAREMLDRIEAAPEDVAGFYFARKTMLGEKWLRISATYPAYVPRLVRHGRVAYAPDGHGEKLGEVDGRFEYLRHPCLHYNFSKGWSDWFVRHNRYSTREAAKIVYALPDLDLRGLVSRRPDRRRQALKGLAYRMPFRPFLRFFYAYVFRGGFLEGRAGLTSATLQAVYEYMTCLKTRELLDRKDRDNERPSAANDEGR